MALAKMQKSKKKKDDRLVEIGELIQERRKILGLTQEGLAELADVSLSTIGAVEQGARPMSVDVAVKISEKLEINLEAMLYPLKTVKPDNSEDRKTVELCYAGIATRGKLVEHARLLLDATNKTGGNRRKK